MTTQITASDLREGDTIPALDNAYVVEVEVNDGYFTYPGGRMNVAMDDDTILVTWHDANGGENYMLVRPDHPFEVTR